MATKKKETAPKKVKAQKAYIGPDVRGSVHLTQYQVFRGDLPEEVGTFFEERKDLKRFHIPVEELASAMAALNNPDSFLARKFAEAKGA